MGLAGARLASGDRRAKDEVVARDPSGATPRCSSERRRPGISSPCAAGWRGCVGLATAWLGVCELFRVEPVSQTDIIDEVLVVRVVRIVAGSADVDGAGASSRSHHSAGEEQPSKEESQSARAGVVVHEQHLGSLSVYPDKQAIWWLNVDGSAPL